MLNDWKWKRIDDWEYDLNDDQNRRIASLLQDYSGKWICLFFDNNFGLNFREEFEEPSIEEVKWRATCWIHSQCNKIANSFHHIRDHLPNVGELYDEYYNLTNS